MAKYCIFALLLGAFTNSSASAAVPACETLLPATTKLYVSIPNVPEARKSWEKTDLGQLIQDPVLQPFVDDIRSQLKAKLNSMQIRLGVTIDDFDDIYGGELCLAVIQPENDPAKHAIAILVDTTGHDAQATALLQRITQNLLKEGATKRTESIGGGTAVVFTMPGKRPEDPTIEALYVLDQDMLIVTSDRDTCSQILASRSGQPAAPFSQHEAFTSTMRRCERDAGNTSPHIRWFVEPIGYCQVVRAANGGRKRRGTDFLDILPRQGFDAIRGIGGHVFFATGDQEILHRTMIYAPPVARPANSGNQDRYNLAARMLDFPNSDNVQPQPWVSRDLGSYYTFHCNMIDAFEHSKTLVNEMLGSRQNEDLMESIIRSLAEDRDGPKVDLRKDLLHHFGERVSVITDCRLPITPECERLICAIELTNPEAVRETINRTFDVDPDAFEREYEGHVIWEVISEDTPATVEPIRIEGGGFDVFDVAEEDEEAEEDTQTRLLSNYAITVAHGHLVVATHVDSIVDLLRRAPGTDLLEDAVDYQQIQDALAKLGAAASSFRFFTRTEDAYRPTYELIRQGRMPESKTMLGKLLNRFMGPDEEGIVREQQINGAKMPEFDAVRRYLGPAGAFVQTETDGWFLAGCVISKDAP